MTPFAGLRRLDSEAVRSLPRAPLAPATLAEARAIVDRVVGGGERALREIAERFGDVSPGAPLFVERGELEAAFGALPPGSRQLLERVHARIRSFADAQRRALVDVVLPVPGGRAGLRYQPMERAGCYAPGGRFPLPSSVLMTVATARAAGVAEIVVASPRPGPEVLAAAYLAGADRVLGVGGAQAIAALAGGVAGDPVDVIVGPGNRWVTAAKQVVSDRVAIDMLAGPSEIVVLADDDAAADRVAADLLAQAEHDPEALGVLISSSSELLERVDGELAAQLADLPTAGIARQALAASFAVLVESDDEMCALADRLAPEHLALHVAEPRRWLGRLRHFGAAFVGAGAAEVLGDYGAGPNHVLPTGGSARRAGALNVLTFLRVQTWLDLDDEAAARPLVDDAAALARVEGLEGHARAAETRRGGAPAARGSGAT